MANKNLEKLRRNGKSGQIETAENDLFLTSRTEKNYL
jgi:hypothetical protein